MHRPENSGRHQTRRIADKNRKEKIVAKKKNKGRNDKHFLDGQQVLESGAGRNTIPIRFAWPTARRIRGNGFHKAFCAVGLYMRFLSRRGRFPLPFSFQSYTQVVLSISRL